MEVFFGLVFFPFVVEDFRVVAREECAEVFFWGFCTLFFFVFAARLFAFFDGDTDDLHRGGTSVIGVAWRDGHEYIESFHHLTEYAVPVVQVGGGAVRDEELRAICSGSRVFQQLCRTEGIIPALETSHAFAYLPTVAKALGPDADILVCLSGRGDKDLETVLEKLEERG